jgi:hypothetical protein
MKLTAEQEAIVASGVRTFVAALEETGRGGTAAVADALAGLDSPAGLERYTVLLDDVAHEFPDAMDSVVEALEPRGEAEAQGIGLPGGFGRFFVRAVHRRICIDPEHRQTVMKALAEARRGGARITSPESVELSVQASIVVAVAIASVLPVGLIGMTAETLIGGVALLVFQSGIDAFCAWAATLEARGA